MLISGMLGHVLIIAIVVVAAHSRRDRQYHRPKPIVARQDAAAPMPYSYMEFLISPPPLVLLLFLNYSCSSLHTLARANPTSLTCASDVRSP